MGFMDELKKLTQPYEDEGDFFEGADESYKPQPKAPKAKAESRKSSVSAAQRAFENSFADSSVSPMEEEEEVTGKAQGGLFGNRAAKQPRAPKARGGARRPFGGAMDSSVILFSPKSFDEAGELVGYMMDNRTVVMTLEGVPGETARRLLDFISGIAYALQGKITPVSAKTYFITPQDVDILGAQETAQTESAGHYL